MNNKSAKKAIASYYILFIILFLPVLIPVWLITDPLVLIGYCVCVGIYVRIAINLAVRATIMPSLSQELDAEKYAAIIKAKPFRDNYSHMLNLYFAVGDYQSAYNIIISSLLLQNKKVKNSIYLRLLLCSICFEREDYEGLKNQLAEIDNYFKYNPNLKIHKQDKEVYEFYLAFSKADYESACANLERRIKKYSRKKNNSYALLNCQYKLAVTKRMMGDVDEAGAIFEQIKEPAQKLFLSTLAQKQIAYISGTLEETMPEPLEVTEKITFKSRLGPKILLMIGNAIICISCLLLLAFKMLPELDSPKQENKDLYYITCLEDLIEDDYEECQILGYFNIYTDYADETYMMSVDSLFLVESNGRLDLHTLYTSNEEYTNLLNVKDIQVNKLYEYKIHFAPYKVGFVLTEKKRDIPENTLYYYIIDGYYFCVISISDI